jgi:EmrB/QacA subfamily drug resistance transporter
MSVVGVPMLMGPVLGPVLGGWLVTDFSWRWIFFVNLPIGAVALPLAWRVLSWDRPKGKAPLDVVGLALLSPGASLLVYGLSETASSGGFTAPGAVVGILGGLALITAFVFHAGRTPHPLIDLSLFRQKAFSAAAATTFLLGATLFGAMILMPLYFQVVRGEDALSAGLLLAPQGLGAALAMPIAGRVTDRGGAGKMVLLGLFLVMAGTFAYTQLTATTSYTLLAFSLFVRGLGIGSSMMPAMSSAYMTLAPQAIPRATSALNVINRVGGSLGTAILAVILQHEITSAVPGSGGAIEGIARSGAGAARIAGPVSDAFGKTFWWSLALTLLAIGPALLLPRSRPSGPASGTTGPSSPDNALRREDEFATEAAMA